MYPPHHFGGYELVWQSAVEHLLEQGHQVRVLTTDADTGASGLDSGDVYRELRWSLRDAKFEPLSLRARIALARHNHRILEQHLNESRPHVVGWWSMGGLTLTMLESVRRHNIPAVAFVHDDWLDYGRWADGWLHMFRGRRSRLASTAERLVRIPASVDFASAATYLFVSEHTRQHALNRLALPRTGIVHSGIREALLEPAVPREWSWRLLYVGRLDPRKGVDTAVQAMPRLPAEATLELIGGWDVKEAARLQALAERLGVESRVTFLGQRDQSEVAAAYERADVVVFPVRWDEPWGLVPLEAMAKGRPVVATGRGGSGEYLRHGDNCLLFDAGDHAGLAAAVRQLASDALLRQTLRSGGLKTAPQHTEAGFNTMVERALQVDGARRPIRVATGGA